MFVSGRFKWYLRRSLVEVRKTFKKLTTTVKKVFSSFVCQDEDDIESFSYKRNRALVHLQLNTSCVCDSSGQFSRDPEPDVSVYDVHEGVDPLKREATMEVKGNRLHVTRYVWI